MTKKMAIALAVVMLAMVAEGVFVEGGSTGVIPGSIRRGKCPHL